MFPEMQVSESEYDWILLNVNLSGYYRVNYDQINLKRLARLLENDPKVRSCLFSQAYEQTLSIYFFIQFLPGITLMEFWNNDKLTIAPLKSLSFCSGR